jgi:uncharacterized protein (DUF2252 family)
MEDRLLIAHAGVADRFSSRSTKVENVVMEDRGQTAGSDIPATEISSQGEATLRSFSAPRRSIEERLAAGKALRERVPRASHAECRLPAGRDDPIDILLAQAKTRVAKLVPIRHARMLASPFAFYRGGASIMARDLQPTPTTRIKVQACGDAHLANFGAFASAERNLVFGINDFDETVPGPWEWDLKRLVASIDLCSRFLGADRAVTENAIRSAVQSYREHMQYYARMGYLALWYETIDEERLFAALPLAVRKSAKKNFLDKAKLRTHLQVLERLTDLLDDHHRIMEDRPLVVRETRNDKGVPIKEVLGEFLQAYLHSLSEDRRELFSRYRIVDVARKVVGVGSVGTRCWVVFMEGAGSGDPLFIQAKEAQTSALAPYVGSPTFENEGHRVVKGQRLIQGAPDILLGWGQIRDIHFYVRQLRDMKGSVALDPDDWDEDRLVAYTMVCGWALALAHAKSGDAAMIAGYVGKSEALDDALVSFAEAYATQVQQDYEWMRAAAKARRISVARVF